MPFLDSNLPTIKKRPLLRLEYLNINTDEFFQQKFFDRGLFAPKVWFYFNIIIRAARNFKFDFGFQIFEIQSPTLNFYIFKFTQSSITVLNSNAVKIMFSFNLGLSTIELALVNEREYDDLLIFYHDILKKVKLHFIETANTIILDRECLFFLHKAPHLWWELFDIHVREYKITHDTWTYCVK